MKENKFSNRSFESVIDEIINEKLDLYEDCETYVCDLPDLLTEDERIDGTPFIWTEIDRDFIREYWEKAEEAYDEIVTNCGLKLNPFEDPGTLANEMINNGMRERFSRSKYLRDAEEKDDPITLTADVIRKIREDLKL